MPTIRRSALVEHSAARMFALVNDVAAYPRRFDWCEQAQVLEADDEHMVARLDLGLGALRTWFTTRNTLSPPHHIELKLVDGPFRKLGGRWEFHALDESACKVTLTLEFEPAIKLLGPAMAVGFQSLADRMVDDFVRVADRGAEPAVPAPTPAGGGVAGVKVEVVRAWPQRFEAVTVELADGATLAAAVAAAGWQDDAQIAACAVFGVKAGPDTPLREGDRVELLRPLQIDPKEARRRRAEDRPLKK